jgi:hypothetical protein
MLETRSGTESTNAERHTDGGMAGSAGRGAAYWTRSAALYRVRSLFGRTSSESAPSRAIDRASALIPYVVIFVIVTMTALPMLRSGQRINRNPDFYQYASRHEAVRKSIIEYHSVPLRSHWLGGGYPTIADPEDPTLNPLVLLTVLFGTTMGLKLIAYVALLTGGLATYAFTRSILGYTRFGALYSGLVYGTSLFIPMRLLGGNPNEVYAAFVPLCLLLLGLACQGRKMPIVILPVVFYTMLSDGKAHSLMAMFYIGVLCLLAMIPSANALSSGRDEPRWPAPHHRPLKFFLLVMALTALISMMRILPAEELIRSRGGIQQMLTSHPKEYESEFVHAYTVERLWKEAVSFDGRVGQVTIGWIPLVLSGVAFIAFFPHTLAWGLSLVLFVWLALAHRAPVDLLEPLWNFPVFDTIYRPDKYFSFQIAFTIAVVSGRSLSLLEKLRSRWLKRFIAIIVIVSAVGFLYPKARSVHGRTFTREAPVDELWPERGFFQVAGMSLPRYRRTPPRSLAYLNVGQNIGTIDWYTAIPIRENAEPKYFVGPENEYISNPAYRGEAFFDEPAGAGSLTATPVFQPNSIAVSVEVTAPTILVINQNFHRDWHADHGEVFGRGGRLAVRLDDMGTYVVHLRYHPRSFYLGLAITMSSLLGVVWVCWTYATGQLNRWSQCGPLVLKHSSRAILLLIK